MWAFCPNNPSKSFFEFLFYCLFMTTKEIAWDLSEIFSEVDDPEIDKRIEEISNEVNSFKKKYKGKIIPGEFGPEQILTLLQDQEKIFENFAEFRLFASLAFSANMTIPERRALNNKKEEFQTEFQKELTFLDLELGELISKNKELISNPRISNYKHHLERLERKFAHKLSEVEENIIQEKDQYGVTAWSQLQSTWLNTREFDVEVEGEEKTLSYGKANGLLPHPDRKTRESANKAIYGKLGEDEEIFSSALRSICGDWVKVSKRREYDSEMHQSLIDNDTERIVIDNLMDSIENNVNIYRNYLKTKAELMNLPKLGCHDIIAPLPDSPDLHFEWEETKRLITQAYGKFDPLFEEYVSDIFSRNHIDGAVRKGKRNGAFCATWHKGKSAYILLSFNNTISDVFTLAHELGHGIHAYLYTRNQSYLNTQITSTVAESASIFGELLLTDLLIQKAQSKKEKISILTSVLDNAGMAIFQVSARVWFEQSLYKAINDGVYLEGDAISERWMKGRDKIYGEAVDWFDVMRWEWTMKPHYFMPNYRFYNYPYVYGALFVYSLYRTYLEEGKSFIPKFKQLLSAGSSLSPQELARIVDLDITKPEFWELGLKQYQEFTTQIRDLKNQL